MQAVLPSREDLRLAALARYAVVDTLPEAAFDRLAELAGELFGVPIALVSLVDREHQFFKACLGLDLRSTDRSLSFCAHALDADDVLVVPDATLDPRFRDNALVTGAPHIRFYAGAPLITPDGYRLGTLCIIDDEPRPLLTGREERLLRSLAATVMDELELRLRTLELEREAQASRQVTASLYESLHHRDVLLGVSELMLLDLPFQDVVLQALRLISEATHSDWGHLILAQEGEARIVSAWSRTAPAGGEPPLSGSLPRGQGHLWQVLKEGVPLYVDDYAARPGGVPAVLAAGVRAAAWVPLGHLDGADYVAVFMRQHLERPWSAADRALIAAGGRSLQVALRERNRRQLLEQAALTDALTGLPNRRALEDAMEVAGGREALALAVLDLDGLKSVNDQGGHARGDTLLRLFGSALLADLPQGVQAYRTGGDEFVLLGAPDPQGRWADQVLASVDAAVAVLRLASFSRVGASVGVALGAEGASLQKALHLADARMYEDKRRKQALAPADARPEPRAAVPEPPLRLDAVGGVPRRPATTFSGLRVVPERRLMQFRQGQVELSPKELQLMLALLGTPERLFSGQELAAHLWPEPAPNQLGLLHGHLSRLRKKLASLTTELVIKGVSGQGYALHALP